MQNLLERFDAFAGIETENKIARLLERAAFVFLILMILSEPHSIAATQTAWLLGMTAWLIRLCFKPRPKFIRTPLNLALWAFFLWTILTSFTSYAPQISIGKLHGATTFLIFFFVLNNLRNARAAKFLALALVASCMASALWSPIERIYGRGVEIFGIAPNSVFARSTDFNHDVYLKNKNANLSAADDGEENLKPLAEGDAVLEVNGKKVRTPDELSAEIEKNEFAYLECFRTTFYFSVKVRRADLNENGASNALEKLGVESWRRNRGWRYGGFYGHIITYAEVLQMIASLALGLFLARFAGGAKAAENRNDSASVKSSPRSVFKFFDFRFSTSALLLFCFAAMVFALATTFTRAAQIALALSAVAMVAVAGSRKMLLTLALVLVPIAAAGFYVVSANRNAGDAPDDSMIYRQTVYREGFSLWTQDARKFFLGIGMDSTKEFARQWHLFDDGRLMTSHFHSTPLQLLVERGLPALLLWLWILWLYARTLFGGIRDSRFKVQHSENQKAFDWQTRGILLGCFGGLVGFFVSSAVNYSLGDSEVAMCFFMLMGIGVFLSITNIEESSSNS